MPVLCPDPGCVISQAEQYRERILAAVPEGAPFQPLMTLYLTDKTPPEEVRAGLRALLNRLYLYPKP